MRNRVLLLLVVFLALGAGGFAQAFDGPPWLLEPPASGTGSGIPHWSVTRGTTFDVFANPFDAMFNLLTLGAGPTFFDLKDPMVAGGLDNLFLTPAGTPAANGPVYAGVFLPGKMPISLFTNLDVTGNTGGPENASTTVVNATGSTIYSGNTYVWVSNQTDTSFKVPAFESVNNSVIQGLVGLSSSMATGLQVGFNMNNLATSANNYTQVQTIYYDTTPGVVPTPATDYTVSTERTNMGGTDYSLGLGVPFVLKAGTSTHFLNVQLGFGGADNSTSRVDSRTNKTTAGALAYNLQNNKLVEKATGWGVVGSYALVLPGVLSSKDKDNKFIADVDGAVTFLGGEYSASNTTAQWTAPGGGGAPTAGALTLQTTATGTYSAALGFKIGAGAIHSFYFSPASGVRLGIVPSVYADYQMTPSGAKLDSASGTSLTDVNANGVQDTGDTILHSSATYTNATGLPGAPTALANTSVVEVTTSLPMSITIKPAGWIFGITIGTKPLLVYRNTTENTLAMGETDSTYTETVGTTPPAAVTTQVTPVPPYTSASTTAENQWNFTAEHRLAINFDFGGVTLDVVLKAANLFDFESLNIQVNAPLK
jgi:hypothetical protein